MSPKVMYFKGTDIKEKSLKLNSSWFVPQIFFKGKEILVLLPDTLVLSDSELSIENDSSRSSKEERKDDTKIVSFAATPDEFSKEETKSTRESKRISDIDLKLNRKAVSAEPGDKLKSILKSNPMNTSKLSVNSKGFVPTPKKLSGDLSMFSSVNQSMMNMSVPQVLYANQSASAGYSPMQPQIIII